MTRVVWDAQGERLYHTGIDRGMIYLEDGTVCPWTGLVSVTEAPNGGDATATYIDGQKILNIAGGENYEATIESYSLPFNASSCAGWGILQYGLFASNQPKMSFGLSYRTLIGNDVSGNNFGYRIHLIFRCVAKNSDFIHDTIADQVSLKPYSWGIAAVPVSFSNRKPTAHVIFDTRIHSPAIIEAAESTLYGSNVSDPVMLTNDQADLLLTS